jgi:hypothetical protein
MFNAIDARNIPRVITNFEDIEINRQGIMDVIEKEINDNLEIWDKLDYFPKYKDLSDLDIELEDFRKGQIIANDIRMWTKPKISSEDEDDPQDDKVWVVNTNLLSELINQTRKIKAKEIREAKKMITYYG